MTRSFWPPGPLGRIQPPASHIVPRCGLVFRFGTLVAISETLVDQSPRGWFANELADALHEEVQDPLHDLVRAGRLRRSELTGRFLYASADGSGLAISLAPGKPRRRHLW